VGAVVAQHRNGHPLMDVQIFLLEKVFQEQHGGMAIRAEVSKGMPLKFVV
jgi:hypothetical protein